MLFRRKSITVEAFRWFKNGDHPLDYVGDKLWPKQDGPEVIVIDGISHRAERYSAQFRKENDWEGEVVRRFRHPGVDGESICEKCGHTMNDHGWIDSKRTLNPSGCTVCPGDWILPEQTDPSKFYPCNPEVFRNTYERA